jgi:hypothetical protein
MKKQIKLIGLSILLFLCLPYISKAQFINYGLMGGVGVGGFKGKDLKIKPSISPEIGIMLKYNLVENVAVLNFINVDFLKTTFTEGKLLKRDNSNSRLNTLEAAPDRSLNSLGIMYHLMASYSLIENRLDISLGGYGGIQFIPNAPYNNNEPRVYYGATDKAILDDPNFARDSEYLTFDQIQETVSNGSPLYGLTAAVTGGTKKLKILARYDYGLNNFYTEYSLTTKLKQNYLTIGVIYYFK